MANVGKILKKLLDVESEIGDFIASPPSGNPLRDHVQGVYQTACNALGNAPAWARSLPFQTLGSFNRMCRPYWDSQGYSHPTIAYPSEGGQCVGVAYYCDYDSPVLEAFPGCGITYNRVRAPQLCYGPCSTSQEVLSVVARCPGVSRYRLSVYNGDGSLAFDTGTGSNGDQGYRNIVFTPVAGGADPCGNEPGNFEPGPSPPPDPGPYDPTYEPRPDPRNPGWPDIPIPPYDDPDLGPGCPLPGPYEPGGDGRPGAPIGGEPGGGTAGGGGGDEWDFGDPGDGYEWVGVCVSITVPRTVSGIIPSSQPQDIFPRVVGNLRIIFTSQGVKEYDSPVRIDQKTTCAWLSFEGLQVTGFFVNLLGGIEYSFVPYKRLIQETDNGG